MHSERILQLLAKQMGNAASDEEIRELQELLRRYPEHHFLLEILQSIEGEKLHKETPVGEDALIHEGWDKLQRELDNINKPYELPANDNKTNIKRIAVPGWMQWAAAIILVVGSSFFVWNYFGRKNVQPAMAKINQVIVPYGVPQRKLLPDSTVVWLNAGSRIRYAENFIQKRRDVYLEGEAYFKVKHDADHPFIVHAGNIAVRALGTEFNVQAYPDDSRIEATLIKGKVQITMSEKPGQKIILVPNEKLTVTNKTFKLSGERLKDMSFKVEQVMPLPSINYFPEVAWMQDELAFQNEAFGELAKRMERRYNVHLIFKDTVLKKERLTGTFENENIQKALTLLQMTTPFHYRMEGDSVYLNR